MEQPKTSPPKQKQKNTSAWPEQALNISYLPGGLFASETPTLTITTAIPMPTAPMMWNLFWKTSLMASGQGLGGQNQDPGHTRSLLQALPQPLPPAHISYLEPGLGDWLTDGRENRGREMWEEGPPKLGKTSGMEEG